MKSALLATGALALTAAVGYAVYFDYKRRNDVEFRRKLKKEKMAAKKKKVEQLKSKEQEMIQMLSKALEMVKDTEYPMDQENREKFFMECLQKGEGLYRQGDENTLESAVCFYHAVKVYPNPVDLLVILQKSVPEDIVGLVYAMISTENEQEQYKYFTELTADFPSVAIQTTIFDMNDAKEEADHVHGEDCAHSHQQLARRGVHAKQDVATGATVYSETPIATAMTPQFSLLNTHCHGCMRPLPEYMLTDDPDQVIDCKACKQKFCSQNCMALAQAEYHNMLCPNNDDNIAAKVLFEYCKKENIIYPWLVAKFLVKMIWKQTVADVERAQSGKPGPAEMAEEWKHLEMLRYLQLPVDNVIERETRLVGNALKYASPSAKEFLTVERYATIKGNFMFNCYGIPTPAASADSQVSTKDMPPRTSAGEGFGGMAMYILSSYLNHSCQPNVAVSFAYPKQRQMKLTAQSKITSSPTLVLKALKPIAAGEELVTSYVPLAEMSREERQTLLDQWKFKCGCAACMAAETKAAVDEAVANSSAEEGQVGK